MSTDFNASFEMSRHRVKNGGCFPISYHRGVVSEEMGAVVRKEAVFVPPPCIRPRSCYLRSTAVVMASLCG